MMKACIIALATIAVLLTATHASATKCGGIYTSRLDFLAHTCKIEINRSTGPISRTDSCAELQDHSYEIAEAFISSGFQCSGSNLAETQANIRRASQIIDSAIRVDFVNGQLVSGEGQ